MTTPFPVYLERKYPEDYNSNKKTFVNNKTGEWLTEEEAFEIYIEHLTRYIKSKSLTIAATPNIGLLLVICISTAIALLGLCFM